MKHLSTLFTGDLGVYKKCSQCQLEKPIGAFSRDSGANYRRHECRDCARKNTRIINQIKKCVPPPGSNYQCPICHRTQEDIKQIRPNKKGIWNADHDHKTGKFRGWLCYKCNLGLGNFSSVDDLRSAVKYLETTCDSPAM